MKTKELLALRARMRKKKPAFVRQDSHKRAEVKPRWRKPKGLHAKLRLGKSGHQKRVKIGFGFPAEVRNLSKDGLVMKKISTPKELDLVNPKTEGIIISSTVGAKKKIDIIKKAAAAGIKIINLRSPEEFENTIKEKMQKKKQALLKKQEKNKEAKPSAKKKKTIEEDLNADEKKEQEKKEKDKLLTRKEA